MPGPPPPSLPMLVQPSPSSQDPRTPQSDASSPSEHNTITSASGQTAPIPTSTPRLFTAICVMITSVGKSTNNLCLTCNGKDCGTVCAKRDHITSHLRGMSFRRLSLIRYSSYNSTHASQASCLRGKASSVLSRTSLGSYITSIDLQQNFQATPGPQKARENTYRRTPRTTQALQGNYCGRPGLCFKSAWRNIHSNQTAQPRATAANPQGSICRTKSHSTSRSDGE